MITQPPPLIEVFAEMPDLRHCRGKRPPLPAMLSLACCAMLCGYRTSLLLDFGGLCSNVVQESQLIFKTIEK